MSGHIPGRVYLLKAIQLENGKCSSASLMMQLTYLIKHELVDITDDLNYVITEKGKELLDKHKNKKGG